MIRPRNAGRLFWLAACGVCALAARTEADVNLEWRIPSPIVRVGATVDLGLYAVADVENGEPIAGLDAIVHWDSAALQLMGKEDNGPYLWLRSAFPNDSGVDGLNADCTPVEFCDPYTEVPYNDGDALYTAWSQFPADQQPTVTTEGLLVTSMVFTALAATPATEVGFIAEVSTQSYTKVVHSDPEYGTWLITGELRPVTISIAPCGTAGDFDSDCLVGQLDVGQFVQCLTGPGAGFQEPACEAADFDGDGDVDLNDVAAFQPMFTGP